MDLSHLPARERIVLTAHDLFYSNGIRATGVDAIIAASGVAKLTFYRHFASKDDLVRAFLDHRHERWMAWFIDALGRHGAHPSGGLDPLLATLAEWFAQPGFRGCAFINTSVEMGGALPETLTIVQRHKQEMTDVIAGLLAIGPRRTALAHAAAVAVDGAIVCAQTAGPGPALAALRCLLGALDRA